MLCDFRIKLIYHINHKMNWGMVMDIRKWGWNRSWTSFHACWLCGSSIATETWGGNPEEPSRRGIRWPYEMALDDPKGERP